jgi:hypothetical protein
VCRFLGVGVHLAACFAPHHLPSTPITITAFGELTNARTEVNLLRHPVQPFRLVDVFLAQVQATPLVLGWMFARGLLLISKVGFTYLSEAHVG